MHPLNILFFHIYIYIYILCVCVCVNIQKVSRLKLYLSRWKWIMNEWLIFILDIQCTYSSELSFGCSTSEMLLLIWCEAVYINVLHILKFYPQNIFLIKEIRKTCMELGLENMEDDVLARSCASPKTSNSKSTKIRFSN